MKKPTETERPSRKKAYIIKAAYAVAVGVAFQLVFLFTDAFAVQTVVLLLLSAAFAAPLVVNSALIMHYEVTSLLRLICEDALLLLAPSVAAAAVTELVATAVQGGTAGLSGLGSVIFIGIAVTLCLVFWLVYAVVNAVFKGLKK